MARRISYLLGSAGLLCSLSTMALAQTADQGKYVTDGPYIGAAGGGSLLSNTSPNGGGADENTKFRSGYIGMGTLGYGFGNGLRLELEGAYRRDPVKSVRLAPGDQNFGGVGTPSLMVNGLYDFDLSRYGVDTYGIIPHLGIGAGVAHPRISNAGLFNGEIVSGTDDVFAYQGIAGVDYALTRNFKVNLDYHYFGTARANFDTRVPGDETGVFSATTRASLSDQAVVLGIRYEFNQPPPPPAPMAPPPPPAPHAAAPPPAAPEVQRSFQVFFDFNKSDITEAASRVISQAAANVRSGNLTRIKVTGHTDTVGSAAYNQALSERRANAVKQQLIADGVGGDEITTIGVGKTGLLVPTGDGVREPQNRRAEIVLQ